VLSLNPQCGQGYRFLLFLVSFGGETFNGEESFGVKIFNNDESLEGSDGIHVDKKGEML